MEFRTCLEDGFTRPAAGSAWRGVSKCPAGHPRHRARNGLRTTRWSLSRKSVRTPGHHCAKQRTKNPCKTCLKIHQKQSQRHENHLKATQKHQKSRCGGVRGALGRGLGAMMVPRGAQEPQNVRKPRSRSTLGPPFGRSFSVLFRFFSVFFWRAFSEGSLGGLPGSI